MLDVESSAGSLTTELGWGDPVGNGGGQIISDVLMYGVHFDYFYVGRY